MKGKTCSLIILFALLFLISCSGDIEQDVVVESDIKGVEQEKEERYLELVELEDYAPVYKLQVKMKDKEGNPLFYDESKIPELEPSEELEGVVCFYDGGEVGEKSDRMNLKFWNRGHVNSVTIRLEELEYELSILEPPKPKEVILEQELDLGDATFVLDKAELYPCSLLLHLTGIEEKLFQENMYLLRMKDSEMLNAPSVYQDEAGNVSLLYTFEKGFDPAQVQTLLVGDSDEYLEFELSLVESK